MRTIKFRAWDSIEKKMKSLSRVSFGDDGSALTIIITPTYTPAPHDYLVDGESGNLMQFTGLLDKNGKEIYEGDVVSVPYDYTETVDVGVGYVPVAQWEEVDICEVVFKDGALGFIAKENPELTSGFVSFADYIENYDRGVEIIGNVFENPELLTKDV